MSDLEKESQSLNDAYATYSWFALITYLVIYGLALLATSIYCFIVGWDIGSITFLTVFLVFLKGLSLGFLPRNTSNTP